MDTQDPMFSSDGLIKCSILNPGCKRILSNFGLVPSTRAGSILNKLLKPKLPKLSNTTLAIKYLPIDFMVILSF